MKGKTKTIYVCQECGFETFRWLGKCPSCNGWNTIVEEIVHPQEKEQRGLLKINGDKPKLLREIGLEKKERANTGISEFDRVIGGGVVCGSVVLIGGEPGIGKSTLLLEIANYLANVNMKCLYVTGEESPEQVKWRADRLGANSLNLYIVSETNLEAILSWVEKMKPKILFVDSIQTVYSPLLSSAPGTVSQVRECGAEFLRVAKRNEISVFIVGHVTKDGSLAGPRTLEHIVDTVLTFEGERFHSFRILRAVKNRFGATSEIGVFEMGEAGLTPVVNPSQVFLSERKEDKPGSVVTCSVSGSRPILLEIQALVSPMNYGIPQRVTTGVDSRRLSLLLAVLERRVGIHLGHSDIFVNITGGIRIEEPACDIGICTAIASAHKGKVISREICCFGEVGLGGEIRRCGFGEKRIREAEKLGFKICVVPDEEKDGKYTSIKLVKVKTLKDALSFLLKENI